MALICMQKMIDGHPRIRGDDMFGKLKIWVRRVEEDLSAVGEQGLDQDSMGNLATFIDFLNDNFSEINKNNNPSIRQALKDESPEAAIYLGDDFFEIVNDINRELYKEDPDDRKIYYQGTELLDRLKSFIKVSSPSTF